MSGGLEGRAIGFVGAGNMGEALIRGLVVTGRVPADRILASDPRAEHLADLARRHGILALEDNLELVRRADVVVLAVKPQILAAVLGELRAAATADKLFVSIAAGVPTRAIREALGVPARLVRVMPNTPALVLEGATAVARADGLAPGDLDTVVALFEAVGRTVVVGEALLDAVTGLSGSGPAYVALVVEALADGGVACGLDRATALALAIQTVLGSARLLRETGLHPGALKDMVSSPGGTTIAGLAALEAGALRGTLIGAVEAAARRSRELGRGAG